jgi:hypothetical protein
VGTQVALVEGMPPIFGSDAPAAPGNLLHPLLSSAPAPALTPTPGRRAFDCGRCCAPVVGVVTDQQASVSDHHLYNYTAALGSSLMLRVVGADVLEALRRAWEACIENYRAVRVFDLVRTDTARPFSSMRIQERVVKQPSWPRAVAILTAPPVNLSPEECDLLPFVFRNLTIPTQDFDFRAFLCVILCMHSHPDPGLRARCLFLARLREYWDRVDLNRVSLWCSQGTQACSTGTFRVLSCRI